MQREVKNKAKLRNRFVLLTVGVVIVVSILLITVYISSSSDYNNSDYNAFSQVKRVFNSPSEEQALNVAESIDYATISSLERFECSSNPEAYRRRGSSYAYTWVNFIDSKVIDYYQNRYHYQQKQENPQSITFTYDAKVTYVEQLHIFNITQLEQATVTINPSTQESKTITWNNIIAAYYGSDKTTPLRTTNSMREHTFYKNQTTFHKMPPEFDVTFNNCYLVEMDLTYNEVYGPLAGFFVNKQQIVVLNQNFEPVWFSLTPTGCVVA